MPAADRRAAILDAALDVFAEGGYHETSLDAVAARAEISKALIYEHFSSKRELHGALLETYVAELLGRVGAAAAAAEPGEARLRAGLEAFLAFVEERRGAWRMLFRNASDPELGERLAILQQGAADDITSLMARDAPAELARDPAERELLVQMLAQQLVGAVQWLANWWDEHRSVPRALVLELLMDFAWMGLDRLSRGERWQPA